MGEIMRFIEELTPSIKELMPSVTVWLVIRLIVSGVVQIIELIFIINFLFRWQKLRSWFNKKGGCDFMSHNRVETPHKVASVIATVAVVVCIFTSDKVDRIIIDYILTGVFLTYCVILYFGKKSNFGAKAALWYAIYMFISLFVVAFLAIQIGAWALTFYVFLLLLGAVAHMGGSNDDERITLPDGTVLRHMGGSRWQSLDGENYNTQRGDRTFEKED